MREYNRAVTRRRLAGWGRTAWTVADVVEAETQAEIAAAVANAGDRGVIARGLGRSYGAAAQNAGGTVVEFLVDDLSPDVSRSSGHGPANLVLDRETGLLEVSAGVSLDDILRVCVPLGWFVPVTPGTRFVTVGGAIASDIHGKNHHVDGSFGQHVRWMDVLLSQGEVVRLDPESRPAWFWATVGGMGLTGVVLRAAVQMLSVETASVRVETERLRDFDAVCEAMGSDRDDDYRYSVCWVDLCARGSALGRGVLTRGEHASRADVKAADPLRYDPKVRVSAPPWVPNGLLNKYSIRAFNEAWYRKAPSRRSVSVESIPAFFHPLDGVRRWNRLYGTQGFIQYQFIVPLSQTDVLRRVIEEFSGAGVASFLAVLKRMGPQNEAPMSFPTDGWTLTLDMAAGATGLPELLAKVDDMVLDAGGRHYLAKDSHVSPETVRRGYPRLSQWRHTRDEMDPIGLWRSDLARRLDLVG